MEGETQKRTKPTTEPQPEKKKIRVKKETADVDCQEIGAEVQSLDELLEVQLAVESDCSTETNNERYNQSNISQLMEMVRSLREEIVSLRTETQAVRQMVSDVHYSTREQITRFQRKHEKDMKELKSKISEILGRGSEFAESVQNSQLSPVPTETIPEFQPAHILTQLTPTFACNTSVTMTPAARDESVLPEAEDQICGYDTIHPELTAERVMSLPQEVRDYLSSLLKASRKPLCVRKKDVSKFVVSLLTKAGTDFWKSHFLMPKPGQVKAPEEVLQMIYGLVCVKFYSGNVSFVQPESSSYDGELVRTIRDAITAQTKRCRLLSKGKGETQSRRKVNTAQQPNGELPRTSEHSIPPVDDTTESIKVVIKAEIDSDSEY